MEVWYDTVQDQLVVIVNVSVTQCYIELLDNMGDNSLGVMDSKVVQYCGLVYLGPLYGT